MPRIIRNESFMRKLSKLDGSFLDRAEKLIMKVIENPEIGKPMKHNRKGTREVYLPPFRLSYAYDKSADIIVFLDIYHKDEQ